MPVENAVIYVMRHSVEAKKAAAISKHSRFAFGWEEWLHLPRRFPKDRAECTKRLISAGNSMLTGLNETFTTAGLDHVRRITQF